MELENQCVKGDVYCIASGSKMIPGVDGLYDVNCTPRSIPKIFVFGIGRESTLFTLVRIQILQGSM